MIFSDIRRGFMAMLFFTGLLGLAYPLVMTGISFLIAKDKAQGSLIVKGDTIIGSTLIGQGFQDNLFQSRPSASNYDGLASGGSSMALNHASLVKNVQTRIQSLQQKYGYESVPADLVFASGSALDPDISEAAAKFQAAYIAKVNHLKIDQVLQLIEQNQQNHLFNPATVNVLKLNLALENLPDH